MSSIETIQVFTERTHAVLFSDICVFSLFASRTGRVTVAKPRPGRPGR